MKIPNAETLAAMQEADKIARRHSKPDTIDEIMLAAHEVDLYEGVQKRTANQVFDKMAASFSHLGSSWLKGDRAEMLAAMSFLFINGVDFLHKSGFTPVDLTKLSDMTSDSLEKWKLLVKQNTADYASHLGLDEVSDSIEIYSSED